MAATHLEAKGYAIRARNWRCRWGEVDIIAEKDGCLTFVEVKTRRGGLPEDQISPQKARRLVRLVYAYLDTHELDDIDLSIDVVAVELDRRGKLIRLEHYEGAIGE